MQRGINRRPLKLLTRFGLALSYFLTTLAYRKRYQPLAGDKGNVTSSERECSQR